MSSPDNKNVLLFIVIYIWSRTNCIQVINHLYIEKMTWIIGITYCQACTTNIKSFQSYPTINFILSSILRSARAVRSISGLNLIKYVLCRLFFHLGYAIVHLTCIPEVTQTRWLRCMSDHLEAMQVCHH